MDEKGWGGVVLGIAGGGSLGGSWFVQMKGFGGSLGYRPLPDSAFSRSCYSSTLFKLFFNTSFRFLLFHPSTPSTPANCRLYTWFLNSTSDFQCGDCMITA